MELSYVAFDSFGVKSSCIKIKTPDVTITIDPGIAIETDSFPLPFYKRAALVVYYKRKILEACKSSDVIAITHYHYDHHIPEKPFYKDKLLLIKHPTSFINKSQRDRAAYFLDVVKNHAKEIKIADSKLFVFGNTEVKFSKPLWHGPKGTKLGYVLMVSVSYKKEKILFTSDLNGIYIADYVDLIASEKPSIIIMDGFPSYLLGYLASYENLKKAISNNIKLLEKTNAKLYVIDHHLLRDYRYREIYYEVYKAAKEMKKNVLTAAEVLNKVPAVIEAYKKYGPTRWEHWQEFTFSYLDKLIKEAKAKSKD